MIKKNYTSSAKYIIIVSELSIMIITYNVMLTQMEGGSEYAWEDQGRALELIGLITLTHTDHN